MEIKEIIKLYKNFAGREPERVEKLPGAGSSRRYYRVYDGNKSYIATFSDDHSETKAFLNLSRRLAEAGARVPEIIVSSESDSRLYIQSDAGLMSLFDVISDWHRKVSDDAASDDSSLAETGVREYLKAAIDQLIIVQRSGVEKDLREALMPEFSLRQILWDLNYFKYDFLKPSGLIFNEDALENDFERLGEDLMDVDSELWGFMYRDFQSRNLMIAGRDVTLIDYQGGRRGPVVYDIVSLLWQAKANLPSKMREEMIDYYIKEYSLAAGHDVKDAVERSLPLFVFFRTLQVLGAYGFRGLIEKKAHFIESIPNALANLGVLLEEGVADDYPELNKCCEGLVKMRPKYLSHEGEYLRIEVFSFSYKKGYPADFSGNGGGFMFDCRGMHNPGRYDEYKRLTGRDRPVIDFLEERGEVGTFLEGAWMMVAPSVETYRRRGFRNLQVAFGCTGGQHRSVYCAQHLAERLATAFPDVKIVLNHREQQIKEYFNS
ncbi:MAG: phosphotransferase [Muribaculaceae bacterium]|nr:phosphotransferase [Muribaculaceae bacterium]